MGDARRRGTLWQRREQAIARLALKPVEPVAPHSRMNVRGRAALIASLGAIATQGLKKQKTEQ